MGWVHPDDEEQSEKRFPAWSSFFLAVAQRCRFCHWSWSCPWSFRWDFDTMGLRSKCLWGLAGRRAVGWEWWWDVTLKLVPGNLLERHVNLKFFFSKVQANQTCLGYIWELLSSVLQLCIFTGRVPLGDDLVWLWGVLPTEVLMLFVDLYWPQQKTKGPCFRDLALKQKERTRDLVLIYHLIWKNSLLSTCSGEPRCHSVEGCHS